MRIKGWKYMVLLAVIGVWLAGSSVLADGLPPELEEQGIEFSLTNEMSFDGSLLFSKPRRGFYDDLRRYEVFDWDTEFKLLYITSEYDLKLDYRITFDGREERVSGGEIEPFYYRSMEKAPYDLIYEENPLADQTIQYPLVPKEYQYLKDSESTVKIEYILCVEDTRTGEKAEKSFLIAWFYGEKVPDQTVYEDIPDGCRLHRVKEGDTLWAIAKQYLDDPFRFGEICELNRGNIKNTDIIYEKQVIYVPIE